MALFDALLLDPYRMNVWMGYRTDGVAGTGTQSDPFDGSTQTKFDALMNALPIAVASITNSGTTATVTAINHGYANGNLVFIAGATGSDGAYYNGTFTISNVNANTFQYTMSGTPSGAAAGTISCRLSQSSGPLVPLPVNPPIAVHLGPGTFQTNGYADGVTGGWRARPGMKIVGSGVDVTILQLAGQTANAKFYAIGHAVSPGSSPNLVDYFEVSDLTIDCNLDASSGASTACGAVRAFGNHARVRRIKVINWGTKATSAPCFVISLVTATDLGWVEDCGIEDCVAINPASSPGNTGPITVFHCGGTESPPANPVAYGVAPYIRNCFADSGQSYPFLLEVRGLSLAWCKAGIIEGNQIHNVSYGVYQQTANAQDILIRNNWFKNVNKGVLLGNLGAMSGSGTLAESMSVATVTISAGHMLSIGDSALLNTTGAYNGIVVTVQSASFSNTTFTFGTSKTTGDTVNSVQKVFGVGNASRLGNFPAPGSLLIEGNVVELATATSGSGIIALHLNDSWAASTPSQDPSNPYYVFSNVVIRDNKLRYLDGTFESNYVGYGMQLNSAANLLVRNNVIESAPTSPPPMQNDRCGAAGYFNNLEPSGVLIQGVNGDNGTKYDELSTEADDALVMGLFNKKS